MDIDRNAELALTDLVAQLEPVRKSFFQGSYSLLTRLGSSDACVEESRLPFGEARGAREALDSLFDACGL